MSPGTATSAGSRARPGKAACESRCRVLAWARRGAWGQPGLEGRGGEGQPAAWAQLPSPPGAAPSSGALGGGWLGQVRGTHAAPSNTLRARLCPPWAPSPWLLQACPALRDLAQALCATLMRRPPRRAEGRITSLSQQLLPTLPSPPPPHSPPHFHYWSSSPSRKELLGIWPTPHQAPTLTLCRSWGVWCTKGGPLVPSSHESLQGGSRMADHCVPSSRGQGPVSASWNMVQLPDLRGCFHLLLGPGSSCGGRAKGGSPPTPCSNHRPAPGTRPAGPLSLHHDFPGPEMFTLTLLGHLVHPFSLSRPPWSPGQPDFSLLNRWGWQAVHRVIQP